MTWRSVIENPGLMDLCFQLYSTEKVAVSRVAIEFMVIESQPTNPTFVFRR